MKMMLNIYRLGVKELWSLLRDPILLVLILFTFSVSIYTAATAMPDGLHLAPIAVIDEDRSPLSGRIVSAFYPPLFTAPDSIGSYQADRFMDQGDYTFILNIPPNFQKDALAGKAPDIQLNVDATRMSQAFTGSAYVQSIVMGEATEFIKRYRNLSALPVELVMRARFNPNLTASWFGSLTEIINNITMLSIILTGAALIREREHGTIEHLLVMPVRPTEVMMAKVWSMGLVVLLASGCSLVFVAKGLIGVVVEGSIPLFLCGTALHLFATTSIGIFLATIARSMPQFAILMILVILPMQLLSGGSTPWESMPYMVQKIMSLAPAHHFVELGQGILFRGAGLGVLWPSFLALLAIGSAFFAIAAARFRKTISQMS